jgi:hypothetical protein
MLNGQPVLAPVGMQGDRVSLIFPILPKSALSSGKAAGGRLDLPAIGTFMVAAAYW